MSLEGKSRTLRDDDDFFLASIAALTLKTIQPKPVRLIVPFAPGGPADFLARLIGPKPSDAWG